MTIASKHVLIVGAGLAGSLLAVYMARMGWRVSVYERRQDPRAAGYAGGRSINLALSARGLWGLAGVGLDSVVMERDAIPMRGRMLHSRDARAALAFQPYSADPKDAINSVSRGGLNLTLLNAAARERGVEFHFNQRCIDIDLEEGIAYFLDEASAGAGAGGKVLDVPCAASATVAADLIVGADGAFSAVRGRLQKTDRFEYAQTYLSHGYKELHIPAVAEIAGASGLDLKRYGAQGPWAMEPNALHIWPRGGSMMIALPNRDGSFTCTLFWPYERGEGQTREGGAHAFADAKTDDEVRALFEREYPDAVPLMPTLVEDFRRNPVSSLVTVRCWPWSFTGKRGSGATTMVLGDAAHAIVPFYGQGMNCAFEDVRVLAELLSKERGVKGDGGASSTGAIGAVAREFERLRKPNADAIADMAVENFEEMRDKVAQPGFLYKKRVEQAVHEAFPGAVTPQYNLVSFSTVPYAEARRRGRALDAVIQRIVEVIPLDQAQGMEEGEWKGRVREAAGRELREARA